MNMQNPFVSIIVPVYRVELYIKECLLSIIAQKAEVGIECILVDDCTDDKSAVIATDIINSYKGKIVFKLLHNDRNEGLSYSRNRGINEAKGEYLLFLDSDDALLPGAISNFYEVVNKYNNVELIQGNIKSTDKYLSLQKDKIPLYSKDTNWISNALLKIIPMTSWNKLVRRDFILKNSLFFEKGIIHEDELWRFYLSRRLNSIAFCLEVTYFYRTDNDTSIINNKSKKKSCDSLIKIISIILRDTDKRLSRIEFSFLLNITISIYKNLILEIDEQQVERYISNVKKLLRVDNSFKHKIIYFFILWTYLWVKVPSILKFNYNIFIRLSNIKT